MFKNLISGVLFSLLLAGCAGDPVRIQLPPTHPADHRAQEPEFWTIPNPFAETVEGAAAGSPADKPAESDPSQHRDDSSTGSGHTMPEGGKSVGGERPNHMQHRQ